jgi:hypothetical protein
MQNMSRRGVCARCGRLFYPAPFNAGHQRYCRHPSCILERKRKGERHRYKDRYASNATFRKREQKRCREGNRQRRVAAQKIVPDIQNIVPAATSPPVYDMHNVVAGFIAQTIGTTDPVLVAKQLDFYGDWGRRLAVRAMICGPPGG